MYLVKSADQQVANQTKNSQWNNKIAGVVWNNRVCISLQERCMLVM